MLISPAPNRFGAFVEQVSIDAFSNPTEVMRLRRAVARYGVLVFPKLSPDLAAFAAIARVFGPLRRHDFVPPLSDDCLVHEIRKEPSHAHNFGGVWHSDGSYLMQPPSHILLRAVTVPESGGDTMWACQYSAVEAMPTKLASRARGLRVWHDAAKSFGSAASVEGQTVETTAEHPLIRWVQERRSEALFHSGPCVAGVVGISADEGRRFLHELFEIATAAKTFRLRWGAGDVVLWDNRSTLHRAINDYPGQRRVMWRAMIGGEAPLARSRIDLE